MNGVSNRISSIDLLRGLVMLLMALDHVRDFFHNGAMQHDPLDLQTTTPILFFTRWITHYCAPVFVFLSGTSAYLSGLKKTKKQLSSFLITRGVWLIVIEFSVVSLGWSFNPFYNTIVFQVIGAIGMSMIVLGMLVWLPFVFILMIGSFIVCFHNLLDVIEMARNGNVGFLWDLIHHGGFNRYEFVSGHSILIIYPFLPWAGLMTLGYCFGKLFETNVDPAWRRKILLFTGSGMVMLFILIRYINLYGDAVHWSFQKNALFTFFSFITVTKYPPSLLFVLMTIGPALIMLALTENLRNRLTQAVSIFGRVPFFYYILHIYLIHILTVILFFVSGHTISEISNGSTMFLFRTKEMGLGLLGVYATWLLVLVMLYPVCKWYNNYKSTHREWWLSYL